MQNTIRLTALCDITGQSKEAVRNYQKHGDAPWLDEKEFGDATQRRYSGYHALALILAEMLRAQGCSVSLAGEFVQVHETAINMFLDEVGDNLTITPRFVLALQTMCEDEWSGAHWLPHLLLGYGTQDEVSGSIGAALASVGTVKETRGGRTSRRVIAGPWVAIAPLSEAYRILCKRAKSAGYVIDGRNIFKVSTGEAE